MKQYARYEDYDGGGAILNAHTTCGNVIVECKTHEVSPDEVFSLIANGKEVIILDGKIRGVHNY